MSNFSFYPPQYFQIIALFSKDRRKVKQGLVWEWVKSFDFIFNIGLELSQWPDGHYTIPMSKYGCPESEANGWRSGALSIVTMETVDIQKSYDSSQQSISLNQNNEIQTFNNGNETQNTNLLGPFWKNGFVLHFCTKTKHVSISNKPDWPDVINMVYRSEDLCPVGMYDTSFVLFP